ncbi:hypothetical protein SPBR_07795 [Sporothrix brasiliensis 5110]|uniref:Uncharacterized protein n=1 Tax=Sporothrix brasiliensis 5110 TaxID=1398154 RepID=A0A0C2EQW1_9PEZI|nr:uncharacterized protein SPBR_07795 [Sporothrix brasiliensis 5110]KIH88719.1 hypothetical protein SPBR_07795 [Sporothrix brasiliensis 5110]
MPCPQAIHAEAAQRPRSHASAVTARSSTASAPAAAPAPAPALTHPVVENSTAARFVSRLKEIQIQQPKPGVDLAPAYDGPSPPVYEYFTLNSDTSHAKCTFKLPPYPYAVFLARQFMIYVAHDWHWFRLRRFHERLVRVYTTPDAPDSKDRLWLCQLLVAFVLGASIGGHDPTSHVRRPGSASETPVQVSAVSSVASPMPPP